MRPKSKAQSKSKSQEPIANGTESPQEPLSDPNSCEDVPLVHIGRYNGLWCVCEGHVKSPIPGTIVPTLDDPKDVALYLIERANGKINVAW